jgi:histone arginine demethylase JMJD6
LEEFKETYVNQRTPVIISGIPEEGNWLAKDRWTDPSLFIELYGDIPIKVMEKYTNHGMGRAFNVRIPIALYYDYAINNTADDPFYGFELDFTEKRVKLLEDYKPPDFFKEDFYNLNERTREFYPNYRHFIIGGERTGTNLHVDPKCTGAWNTLLSGHKKWALFPPGTDEAYIAQLQVESYAKKPATYWWQDVVPKLDSNMGMIECIQNPGETIFVPAGWWHSVLNLDFTIAITENLLIPETLPLVWPELKSIWTKFTDFLEETEPELVGPLVSAIPSMDCTKSSKLVSAMYY